MVDKEKKKKFLTHAKKLAGNQIALSDDFGSEYNKLLNSMSGNERRATIAKNIVYSSRESSDGGRWPYDPSILRGMNIKDVYEGLSEFPKNRDETLAQYRVDASNGLYGDSKRKIALEIARLEKESPRNSRRILPLLSQLYSDDSNSDLEKVSSIFSILGLGLGSFFLVNNFLGNNQLQMSPGEGVNYFGWQIYAGIILVLIGAVGLFFWIKVSKKPKFEIKRNSHTKKIKRRK